LYINILAFIVGFLIYIEVFYSLLLFRLIQGFCVGCYSAIAPLIIKELAPIEISGTLGSLSQLNVTIGVFLGSFISYVLKKITGDPTGNDFWFISFGIPQITIVLQTVILLFVFPYETPKYLLSVGK
jgi:SP family sugar:H+ symporter-like MFS transporter